MSRAALLHAPQHSGKSAAATSLRIGPAHDSFEHEADQAAEKVASGEQQHVAWSLSRVGLGAGENPIQRQCSCGGTCDDCKKKKEVLQRYAASSAAVGSHAPASVASTLSRPGSSLDPGTRSFMESRFGQDFSSVRIHTDDHAAASASDVSANAYTVGSSIVFNQGKYQPYTTAGRKLLAHELAHVVQQNSVGQRLQRDFDDSDEGRKNAADIDETFAGLYSTLYSDVESQSPDILISYADNLSRKYEEAQGRKDSPLSQLQLASILNRIYRTLKSDESSVERDNDGALLTRGFGALEPWSKNRPHSVTDIPTFTPERILAWQADAAANDREQSLRKGKPAKKQKEQHTPPPGFDKLVGKGDSAAAPPANSPQAVPQATKEDAAAQTPGVEVQEQTSDEKDSAGNPGAGPVVQAGIAKLQAAKLSSINSQKADAKATEKANPKKPEAPVQGGGKSLLDACAQIWFLSNRMYLLDRSGHLAPRDDAWFDISSVAGLRPGGVYFVKPGDERVSGMTINFRYFVVSGTGTETAGVAINFPRVLTALIPVLDINKELAEHHAGIGLIIAPTFAQRQLGIRDISGFNLLKALGKTAVNIPWAVNAEVNRVMEHPVKEVINQAIAFGIQYVSKFIPIVGQAAMLYQLIDLAGWLGDVANVAAYAQTEDEVDIAGQAIAKKLAQFIVFEIIHRRIKGAFSPEGLPGAKNESGVSEPKAGAKETSVKDTPEPKAGTADGAPGSQNVKPDGKTSSTALPNQELHPDGLPGAKSRGVSPEPKAAPNDLPVKDNPGVTPGKAEGAPGNKNMEPAGKSSPATLPREGNLAHEGFDSPGTGEHHEIIGTEEGFGRCSESPCPAIPVVYAEELAKVPEFKARYEALRKLGETDVPEATKGVRDLAKDIESYRLSTKGEAAPQVPATAESGKGAAGTKDLAAPKAADQAPGAGDKPAAPEAKPSDKPAAADSAAELKNQAQAKDPVVSTPVTSATAKPAPRAIDDALSPDHVTIAAKDPAVRSRFRPDQLPALDRLQAAYEAYKKREGADAQSPEGWLRSQKSGQPREDAKLLFGETYARGSGVPGVAIPPIPLKDIARPAQYSEPRLQADLATLQSAKNIGMLWARLTAVRAKGIVNGEVANAILNILKGNIGEILAKPEIDATLAAAKKAPGGAGLEQKFGTYIEQIKPNGTYEAPKLFADGLLTSEKGKNLVISDVFEVKSGSGGGAEATTQFFEWREGRLNDGDRLILSDGRKFTYAPGATGPAPAGAQGYVQGLVTAKAHIIAARGAEHLGSGSGDQIGAATSRTALPQTAAEIEYLARLLFESLPQITSQPAAGTPTAIPGTGSP